MTTVNYSEMDPMVQNCLQEVSDRFGAIISARSMPGVGREETLADGRHLPSVSRGHSESAAFDPKSPVATDGYRASLGKHITGKSQMRWIRVVAGPLHPNSKQGNGRCRRFLRQGLRDGLS